MLFIEASWIAGIRGNLPLEKYLQCSLRAGSQFTGVNGLNGLNLYGISNKAHSFCFSVIGVNGLN